MSGKLSSSVKSMKFMRFANGESEQSVEMSSNEAPQPKYAHDNSNWSLAPRKTEKSGNNKAKKVRIIKTKTRYSKPMNVGITTISRVAQESSFVRGRRVIETTNPTELENKKRKAESEASDQNKLVTEDEDDYVPDDNLDTLFKKGNKKQKYNK
ncbi:hypothetical protein TBLA_0I02290 [Henningerozyma blattae CBS 6284]|uniref:Uncharacterized protein n=1 Tax=Henningerozyma blattae (strain ATCC 34711 / CBS 6284 / DSM 70876 / NBRC 10599 / NRRL Y-10934 / UCD 77-7) TaxID=1071380 RepID=I2H935_HENB6|nr:hypothetical protein TBLA_0I02290 [Tetrapisispora blattae CBS 6284]CCH62887.1 hypothetical protein TBLA_0I02290 [Tetrapisispora blattae CBS 6284]